MVFLPLFLTINVNNVQKREARFTLRLDTAKITNYIKKLLK